MYAKLIDSELTYLRQPLSIAEINGSALLTDALAALTEIGYVEGGESNGEVS